MFVLGEARTPGGLLVRPVLTAYYQSDRFQRIVQDTRKEYTSPLAAILCVDGFTSMYAQMLCGLVLRLEVLRIGAAFAPALLRAINFLQLHWGQLADDIETGELTPKVTDSSVRAAVGEILRPDADLARFIREECGNGDWAGIVSKVWPNAKYLDVIVTGSMAQYIPTLDYYSGGISISSGRYTSSECHIGLNLNPMCSPADISYTIMPNMAYFEFIPVDEANDDPSSRIFDLTKVEVGREYEVVVTTYAGLYRYRLGDILHVSGFHNATPQFQFVRRKNVLLSIVIDKTEEPELQCAVDRAAELLKPYDATVLEYTSHAFTKTIPGHYVVYWELMCRTSSTAAEIAQALPAAVLEQCCLEMEEALSVVYRRCRVLHGLIAPLEIRLVRPGTFQELVDFLLERGASINQYKVPRCVTAAPILELLDERVMAAYFSPALPNSQ